METSTLNPKPKTDNLALSFSKTLEEFGIQFQHDLTYKLIWIPVDEISMYMSKFPHIRGYQGEIEISIAKYTNAILVYLANLYDKTIVYLPPDIEIEYHDGDIVVEF